MKIQLSKAQWEHIGKTAGWVKTSNDNPTEVIDAGAIDGESRPIYVDSKNNRYVDIDLGRSKTPNLHIVTKSGEPLVKLKNFVIVKDLDPNDPYKKMRSIRVTYDSGEVVNTLINGTKKMVRDYYLNPIFGPTDYDQAHPDRTHRPVKVEFLD